MGHSAAIGWDRGLTMSWKPRKDDDGWSWSYADDFLPILQRTHGLWKLRNALRLMHTLSSPLEDGPHP